MIFELSDTGYGIRVNGTEFVSFEDWLEWDGQNEVSFSLTEFIDDMKGEDDVEGRYELCACEAV